MKMWFRLFFALPLLLGAGCSDTEDVVPDQQSKIESYLSSTHRPVLLSAEEAEASLDEDPEFYTVVGQSAYRYVRNYYEAGRAFRPEVAYGDVVSLTLSLYVFDYKNLTFLPDPTVQNPQVSMPYYSNNPLLEQAFYQAGLTSGVWNFDPLEVTVGQTPLFEGLQASLPGLRERDTVEIYMACNMAYDDVPLGIVPKQSPIAVFLTVDRVGKDGKFTDPTLSEQQNRCEAYLSGTHIPALVSEQQAQQMPDAQPEFYSALGDRTVFRYICDYYNPARAARTEAAEGDRVQLTFSMYGFEYANLIFEPQPAAEGEEPVISMPYFSNDAALEPYLYAQGLEPGIWTFAPVEVEIGQSEVLQGIDLALSGLREGDTAELYLTYPAAYGDKWYGDIPPKSPVAVRLTVNKIWKK